MDELKLHLYAAADEIELVDRHECSVRVLQHLLEIRAAILRFAITLDDEQRGPPLTVTKVA
jgi:hypothetical protein